MTTETENADKFDAQNEPNLLNLPKANIEVDVEVPAEIWEIAEDRLEKAHEENYPNAELGDYLLDQVRFEYNFEKADTDEC